MTIAKAVALTIILIACLHWTNGRRPFTINITEVKSNATTNYVSVFSEIRNKSIQNALFVEYNVSRILKGRVFLHLSTYQLLQKVYKPFMINTKVDMCVVFLNSRQLPSIVRGIYKGYLQYTDMPARCPVKPGSYHVNNYVPNSELFPPYLPQGKFKLVLHFFVGNKTTQETIGFLTALVQILPVAMH